MIQRNNLSVDDNIYGCHIRINAKLFLWIWALRLRTYQSIHKKNSFAYAEIDIRGKMSDWRKVTLVLIPTWSISCVKPHWTVVIQRSSLSWMTIYIYIYIRDGKIRVVWENLWHTSTLLFCYQLIQKVWLVLYFYTNLHHFKQIRYVDSPTAELLGTYTSRSTGESDTNTHTYIYIYIYIYIITALVVTILLRGFVANQMRYNLESAQYLW